MDEVQAWTYGAASGFATATQGRIDALSDGAIFELVAYPSGRNSSGLASDWLPGGMVHQAAQARHYADGFIKFSMPRMITAGTFGYSFRRGARGYYWQIQVATTGAMALYEYAGAGPVARGSTGTGVVSAGVDITIRTEDEKIVIFVDETAQITYTSAVTSKTATATRFDNPGTAKAVLSNLVCWPLEATGTADTVLDQYLS
jgi:hypothetical protein